MELYINGKKVNVKTTFGGNLSLHMVKNVPSYTKTYIIPANGSSTTPYLISNNGIDWEFKEIPDGRGGASVNGSGCYYVNGRYYMQRYTYVYTTITPYDETSWVKVTSSNSSFRPYFIAYGNGVYVCQYGSYLYTSTDGINFTQRNSIFTGNVLGSILFASNIFVAALGHDSAGGSGAIYTSTDGFSWVKRKSFSGKTKVYCGGLIYDGTKFVLNSSKGLYTSANGISWVQGTKPSGSGQIVYCNGIYLMTLGNNTYVSNDLSSWKSVSTTKTYPLISQDGEKFYRTYFQNSDILETSVDGVNWETQKLPYSDYFNEVCFVKE